MKETEISKNEKKREEVVKDTEISQNEKEREEEG